MTTSPVQNLGQTACSSVSRCSMSVRIGFDHAWLVAALRRNVWKVISKPPFHHKVQYHMRFGLRSRAHDVANRPGSGDSPGVQTGETAMPKGYRHLTYEERCRISALKGSGRSNDEIARQLGRDPSSISRGFRRNGAARGYGHVEVQGKAEGRRSAVSSVPRKMTPELWALVNGRLREGWSPEQVSGRLRLEGFEAAGRKRSCQHVRADREAGGMLQRRILRVSGPATPVKRKFSACNLAESDCAATRLHQ